MDADIAELTIQPIDEGLDRPFPTVGQGFNNDLDGMAAIGLADAGFDGPARFDGSQAIFQGINGYNDFHDDLSSICEFIRLCFSMPIV